MKKAFCIFYAKRLFLFYNIISFLVNARWILLWPKEIDVSIIVLSKKAVT